MKTVILIDDHDMMRRGLAAYFAQRKYWQVVGEAASIEEAGTLFKRLQENKTIPDIVLLDIDLNGQWGLDLVEKIKTQFSPSPRIIVYSVFEDFAHVRAAMRAGAAGYVCKARRESELEAAMETVLAGGFFMPPQLASKLSAVFDLTTGLSKRERQIFDLVQLRQNNKQIAEKLGIALRTVENNLSMIYDKTGVTSRKELETL
jgi:DNA-binding NarL/FixJ family response regulator